jgi:hypothetical protein
MTPSALRAAILHIHREAPLIIAHAGDPQPLTLAAQISSGSTCEDSATRQHHMSVRSILIHVTEVPMLGTLVRLYRGIQELRNQVIEDWIANSRDWTMPGFRAIAVHRLGTWLANRRSGVVKSGLLAVYRALYRYVRNHYGIEIPLTVTIGRRLWLVHQHGIVFHWKSELEMTA